MSALLAHRKMLEALSKALFARADKAKPVGSPTEYLLHELGIATKAAAADLDEQIKRQL